MTATAFRKLTTVVLVLVAAIIVTGAAVRLSGSGLGCSDWPNCEPGALVGAKDAHQAIEQINRLFTGLMLIAIVAALAGAYRRRPKRKDLTVLASALIVGFFGQALVGGIVVLSHLHPATVLLHFLLSAVVLVAALVLHKRAGEPEGPYEPAVAPMSLAAVRAIVAGGILAVASGTVVTNTGPHGGDEDARRFGLSLLGVVRLHSVIVLATLTLTLGLVWRLRRHSDRGVLYRPLEAFIAAGAAQGAIGYWQWFTKLPALVVGFHIAGATAVIVTLTRLLLVTRRPVSRERVPAAR